MPVLVDTYNVLHVTGVLDPEHAGPDVSDLARLIAGSRFGDDAVVLVCDGVRRDTVGDLPGSVSVRYSGGGITADDVIIAEIKASTAPRRLTIVSSDNEIRREARRRGCRSIKSETFLQQLQSDAGPAARPGPAPPARPPEGSIPADVAGEAAAIARNEPGAGADTDATFPAPAADPGSDPDRTPGRGTKPGSGIAPSAAPREDRRRKDDPAPEPSRRIRAGDPEALPSGPADGAETGDPLFGGDVLADLANLLSGEDDRLAALEASRRADAEARLESDRRRVRARAAAEAEAAADAAAAAEAAALADAMKSERAARVLDEAEDAIDLGDLTRIDDLVRKSVPEEDLPVKDGTFSSDEIAEAMRMLDEDGTEPRPDTPG